MVHPRWTRVDVVVDGIAVVVGLVLLATGQPFGLLVIGAAAFSLVSTLFHPLQRWIISVRFRSLLGKST
jgi:hypothetical protein